MLTAASLQRDPPTWQPGIPAAGSGDAHHAKLAARLRYAPPVTQLGRKTINALTFKPDHSVGTGNRMSTCPRKETHSHIIECEQEATNRIVIFQSIRSEIMDILPAVGALIAFTQACIAIAVFQSSRQQRLLDRSTQRIIRIHAWGNDCIDALAHAGQFCLLHASDFHDERAYTIQRNHILQRLSALIDCGRLFYRNVHQDKHGLKKFPARRGYRPEILDPIVAARHGVLAMNGNPDQAMFERLYEWRGRFITLLQYEVDPKWLRKAQYYSEGPGTWIGKSVNATSEPPKWPENRPPA